MQLDMHTRVTGGLWTMDCRQLIHQMVDRIEDKAALTRILKFIDRIYAGIASKKTGHS